MKLPDDRLPEEQDPQYAELITLLQQANLTRYLSIQQSEHSSSRGREHACSRQTLKPLSPMMCPYLLMEDRLPLRASLRHEQLHNVRVGSWFVCSTRSLRC